MRRYSTRLDGIPVQENVRLMRELFFTPHSLVQDVGLGLISCAETPSEVEFIEVRGGRTDPRKFTGLDLKQIQ